MAPLNPALTELTDAPDGVTRAYPPRPGTTREASCTAEGALFGWPSDQD